MVTIRNYFWLCGFMACVIILSNWLLMHRIYWLFQGDFFTYGGFIYPFTFLINDIANRKFGAKFARHVIYVGFLCGLMVSFPLFGFRISLAMALSFLVGQLFNLLLFFVFFENKRWHTPFLRALLSSSVDTFCYFLIAFSPLFAPIDVFFGYQDSSIYEIYNFGLLIIPVWFLLSFGDLTATLLHRFFQILIASSIPRAKLLYRKSKRRLSYQKLP